MITINKQRTNVNKSEKVNLPKTTNLDIILIGRCLLVSLVQIFEIFYLFQIKNETENKWLFFRAKKCWIIINKKVGMMVKGKTVLDSNVQFYCWKENMDLIRVVPYGDLNLNFFNLNQFWQKNPFLRIFTRLLQHFLGLVGLILEVLLTQLQSCAWCRLKSTTELKIGDETH